MPVGLRIDLGMPATVSGAVAATRVASRWSCATCSPRYSSWTVAASGMAKRTTPSTVAETIAASTRRRRGSVRRGREAPGGGLVVVIDLILSRRADPRGTYDGGMTQLPAPAKRVLLAQPRGYCAGVERAIDSVEKALAVHGAPVYVRKQIVHNKHVVADLEAKGAIFVEETSEVPPGSIVVLSAHGVAPTVYAEATERNLRKIGAPRDAPWSQEGRSRRWCASCARWPRHRQSGRRREPTAPQLTQAVPRSSPRRKSPPSPQDRRPHACCARSAFARRPGRRARQAPFRRCRSPARPRHSSHGVGQAAPSWRAPVVGSCLHRKCRADRRVGTR